ncbi:MAG: phage tail fiber protein [Mycobacteriales bacterium]
MAFTDAALNAAVDGIAAAGSWISAHTADPVATGTAQAGTRVQTTWGAAGSGATGGDRTGSQVSIGVAAGVTVTHWGLWSATAAGTFLGGFALGAPEAFGAAGNLLLTPTLDVD